MNQFVPDWSNMGDASRTLGEDENLIELLWCNGHVVMQSQNHRKLPPRPPEKAVAAQGSAAAPAAVQEDEAGLWFPFALADSLDKDIFSDLFYEAPVAAAAAAAAGPDANGDGDREGKPCRDEAAMADEKRGGPCAVSEAPRDLMPPPKSTHVSCSRQQTMSLADGGDNAGDLSELVRVRTSGVAARKAEAGGASSSTLSAIGSSICGSNQVQMQRTASEPGRGGALPSAVGSANAIPCCGRGHGHGHGHGHEATTVASSSGRSNCCFGTTTTTEPTSTSNRSGKRKRLDTTEDSESPSEDAESESAALARKPPAKMMTARRSRAAEVHNLSERRRRDRINEKMRALQELIPHCNKTDKASMLDEAIDYLKSLQLQLQMMWMGSGMAPPVMFPGVHQYLPRMGVGMGAAAAAAMPRMPFMAAPQPVVPTPPVNHLAHGSPGYRGHMPSAAAAVGLAEPYAHYLGVNHLQPPPTPHYLQGVGYYPLGAKAVQQQQNPPLHAPNGSMPPSENAPNTGLG